jgi:hypothetical protein
VILKLSSHSLILNTKMRDALPPRLHRKRCTQERVRLDAPFSPACARKEGQRLRTARCYAPRKGHCDSTVIVDAEATGINRYANAIANQVRPLVAREAKSPALEKRLGL